MSLGNFGDIIFSTSDKRILTFTDFSRSTSARLEEHKLIGQKPLIEFCGPELEKVTFTINLNAANGINPEEELTKWREYCTKGSAQTLIIGSAVIGYDKFIVESVSQTYDKIYRNGFLFSAKADISLSEYITDPKMQPPSRSKNYGILTDTGQPYYENAAEEIAGRAGLKEIYDTDSINALLSLIQTN